MARPLRLEFSGAIYHLTARGNARQKIFFSDADRQLFMDTLAGVVFRYGWICHAYCLMANHYHLLSGNPQAQSLSRHAPAKRHLHSSLQSSPSANGTFVSGPIQGDFGGEGIVPVGALPLHCAQPDAGQRKCTDRHLEMEQLPGYGGIGFGPGVLGGRLGGWGVWEKYGTGAEKLSGIFPEGVGQPSGGTS